MATDLFASGGVPDAATPTAGADLFADPNPPGSIKQGWNAGVAGVKSSLYGVGALAAHAVGAADTEKAALDNVAAQNEVAAQNSAPAAVDWSSPASVAKYFAWTLGNAAPMLAGLAATSVLGRGLGALAGRGMTAANAATALKVGQTAGALVPFGATTAGQVYPEAVEAGLDNPSARALGAGALTAATAAIPALNMEKYLGAAGVGAVRGAGRGALVGATVLPGAMVGQTAIVRAAEGKSLTSPEAISDYIQSLTGMLAPGALTGAAVGGLRGRVTAAPNVSPPATRPENVLPEPEQPLAPITGPDETAAVTLPAVEGLNAPIENMPPIGTGVNEPVPASSPYKRLEAPVAQEADLTMRESLMHQQALAADQITALGQETPTAERPAAQIQADLAAAQNTLAVSTDQLRHVENTMKARGVLAETPAGPLAPRTPQVEPSLIGGKPAVDTTAAEMAVARVKRSLGHLVSSREAKLVPVETPRERALQVAESRGRGAEKSVDEQTRQGAVEAAAVQVSQPAIKGLVESKKSFTPAAQEKLRRVLTDAVNNVAREAAEKPTTEAAKAHIESEVPRALAGRVAAVDAHEIAKMMSAAVDQAHTLYSKGATVDPDAPTITLVRHGLTQENADGRNRGWRNVPLSDEGHAQAAALGARLKDSGIEKIISSDLQRAHDTATAIGATTGAPVETDFSLRPWDIGEHSAKASKDSAHVLEHHAENAPDAPIDGGESFNQFKARFLGGVQRIIADNPGKHIAFVTHHRGERLFNAWVAKGMPSDHSIDIKVFTDWKHGIEPGDAARFGPKGSGGALTQPEFDKLPEPAKQAAVDAFNQVMQARGTELRDHLTQLIGHDPDLIVKTFQATEGSPIGSYTRTGPLKSLISLALNAKQEMSVADHEGYHYAEDRLLNYAERQIVANGLKEDRPLYKQVLEKAHAYDRENKTQIADEIQSSPAEARAYAFEMWRRGELKADGAIARVWQKIVNLMERISNFIKGQGFQSVEDVFTALDRGQFAERQRSSGQISETAGNFQSEAGAASWYRSALNDQVEAMPTKAASAQGWKDQIKGLVQKGAVKQAEIDAVGLNDYLDLQSGKVTKDQVMSFLKENGVRVEETTLGKNYAPITSLTWEPQTEHLIAAKLPNGNTVTIFSDARDRTAELQVLTPDAVDIGEPEVFASIEAAKQAALRHVEAKQQGGGTKFASYQLPGGQNYRELVLSLPSDKATARIREINDELQSISSQPARSADDPNSLAWTKRWDELVAEKNSLVGKTDRAFRSSHYDTPNILAHIRFNERTDAEGKRVLFLEEIQSDWAQKGKRVGFVTPDDIAKLKLGAQEKAHLNVELLAHDSERTAAQQSLAVESKRLLESMGLSGYGDILKAGENRAALGEQYKALQESDAPYQEARNRLRAADVKVEDFARRMNQIDRETETGAKVPSAPFVTKTEAWVALSLKRMIRYASENGFDKIAWTTGEQQAARYDLSKTIGMIRAAKLADGDYTISASGVRGGDIAGMHNRRVSEKELPDVVGKELAGKIIKNEGGEVDNFSGARVYSGLDLKVGGEGMKAFYDKIVPNVANDVLKRLGGDRIGEVVMGGRAASKEGIGSQVQPGFTITPEMAQRAAEGLPLFSKAAVDMARRFEAGELEREQMSNTVAELIDKANLSAITAKQAFGAVGEQFVGNLQRWRLRNIATGNYVSRFSKGYANVQKTLLAYVQRKSALIAQGSLEQLSSWHANKTKQDDITAVGKVLLHRTEKSLKLDSPELRSALAGLSEHQRTMFQQATEMIAGRLNHEFAVEQKTMQNILPPAEYAEWLENRQTQVQRLVEEGYVPERRYGDYTVHIYLPTTDKGGRPQRLTVHYEQFENQAAADVQTQRYQEILNKEAPDLKVENGYRYKVERDASISIQQFLDTARRNGVELTQAERERLAKALVSADSMRRNRMFRRQNIPGYSQDIMRVLHEFVVTTANKVAYSEFAEPINDAIEGRPVDARVENNIPKSTTDKARDLWREDGPQSGFFRNLSDELSDYVLVPDHGGNWSRKLRGAAMTYFIGGSIASGAVNAMSIPMNVVPWLSQSTNYTNAFSKTFAATSMTLKNLAALRDIPRLKDVAVKIPEIDAIPGLREALVLAAEDGRTMDTEIHQIMGMAQGAQYAHSRTVQKAMEVWMAPFKLTEQVNRLTTFIAAYRVGAENKLAGRALYEFAAGAVDNTQNRYDEVNRPGLARDPMWALLFMFKSFPLFMVEMVENMYRANPKSAAYMLLGLTAMTGVQGLPFAETIENLVDTISQRLFNSPFNSRRAMRNVIKDASEALTGADLSELVLRGGINDLTGLSMSSRIGMGDFIPGTRIGAADNDYGRTAEQILGAPFSMVTGTASATGQLLKGDFMGAMRSGGPVAVRNLIKGGEQLDRGYGQDAAGRKLVDVTGPEALWQSVGFTSASLNKAYEMDKIDRQTLAFYTQVRKDFTNELVRAAKDGDAAKIKEVTDSVQAWNAHYPDMPISLSPASVRRDIMMAGVPLNARTLHMLPKQLRGSSVSAETR